MVPLGLISSFLLIPASGSGRRPPKKTQKEREKKTLRKSRPNSMQFDAGNYREFFILNFDITFGHVGAGGPRIQKTTWLLKILLVEAFLP